MLIAGSFIGCLVILQSRPVAFWLSDTRALPLAMDTLTHEASDAAKHSLAFEVNTGQTDRRVQFLSRGEGYTLFLTPTEAVLSLQPSAKQPLVTSRADASQFARTPRSIVRMQILGGNQSADAAPESELPAKTNYFIGNKPDQWRTNVSTYAKVRYRAVYPGIDLVYYGNDRQLEHDFVIHPGADPSVIRLAFEGSDRVEVDQHGDLVLHVDGDILRQRRPIIYQDLDGKRRQIHGAYVLKGENQVVFRLGDYDTTRTLIIDPVLVYSTYLGGTSAGVAGNGERATDIDVDAAGNAYVLGITDSVDFPVVIGDFTLGGTRDAFVTKLDSSGAVIYSTFLGGSGAETAQRMAIDAAGNVYLTGSTTSADFPTTLNAYNTTPQSASFVTKLDPTGQSLVYSTYLPESNGAMAIAVDGDGGAYITGSTFSADFPTTPGAFDQSFGGGGFTDGFVTKLNTTGTDLVFSTYLGGPSHDQGRGISVDGTGHVYVTGFTTTSAFAGPNFPTTPGAFDTSLSSGDRAFVTKFLPDGSGLVYSTFLGTGSTAEDIAVDIAGSAYVTGLAWTATFPTTVGAFQTTCNCAGGGTLTSDVFITRLQPSGSGLVYSTLLGGSGTEWGSAIAIDAAGNAYVAGYTSSANFPTTLGVLDNTLGGLTDGFAAKLNSAGTSLIYSTYLGGTGDEQGVANRAVRNFGIAVDSDGSAHVVGFTTSSDFPITPGAFDTVFAGTSEAFVVKLANTPVGLNIVSTPFDFGTQSAPVTVMFSQVTQAGRTTLTIDDTGPPPPAGFALGNPSAYYDVSTTTSFIPPVLLCIDYTGVSYATEAALRLFHFENLVWVDVTTALDTTMNVICGSSTSMSPFAIFEHALTDIEPPTLQVPGHIIANATSPTGAVIAYEASATDAIDPNPVVVCLPLSGTTFSIGITSVNCSATDASGNRATGSFSVVVKGSALQILDLIHKVSRLDIREQLKVKLIGELVTAIVYGNRPPACRALDDFEASVRAVRTIPANTGLQLIEDARRIASVLGCS
jgi:hypothetical protein